MLPPDVRFALLPKLTSTAWQILDAATWKFVDQLADLTDSEETPAYSNRSQ